MTRLAILEYPDPRLRTAAQPVRSFDTNLLRLADDLFETMYATQAIGLAATQVNVHRQILTTDVSADAREPFVFINPKILSRSRIGMVEESCLSLPGVSASIRRATQLRVRFQDLGGAQRVRDLDGLLAVSLQHELDHLQGKLFVDRLPFFQRLRMRHQLQQRLRRHAAPTTQSNSYQVPEVIR